jgi:uncharacterized protein (DUF488 family)
MTTLYTIGHSNRELDAFIAILQQAGIQSLVDVSAHPHSKHNPQFNDNSLRAACGAVAISYHWAGRQLGGMRKCAADSQHIALDKGLCGYADYMQTPGFQRAVSQLLKRASEGAMAIMCAEQDALQCHRSLISDYLLLQGVEVIHLLDKGSSQPHVLRAEARRESAGLVYDRNATAELEL